MNLPSPAVHLAIGPCLGLGTEHSHMAILGLIQEYNLYIYILYEYMASSKNGGRRTNAWKMMIDDGISRYPYSQTTWQTHIP